MREFDPREREHPRTVEVEEARLPFNVRLAVGLFDAGRITEAEYVFYCSAPIVALHERYWTDGRYDAELQPIVAEMERIERSYGLNDNEYWLIKDAPATYLDESDKYDSVMEQKLAETFRRFAPAAITKKLENEPDNFWAFYEQGRRSVFEKDDYLGSVLELLEITKPRLINVQA